MKPHEAGTVLSLLTSGFHRETMEEATVELWLEIIQPMDAEIATKVALGWVKNQDRFPTISQFRHAYHVERRQADPHELSAAYDPSRFFGLDDSSCPPWVQRWLRRFRAMLELDPKEREKGDWRVFPEQIAGEGKYEDDPRFTRAEAEKLGIMPEDAWC